MRWIHPRFGLISPAQFIPLAEETGMIVKMGEWALHTACAQAARWQRQFGRDLRMAVNVSALQFNGAQFPDTVSQALSQSGLSPRLLELELTESVVMNDVNTAAARMQLLRNLGIRIAVDDFGTGYSSLLYLQKLPIDVLKIDRGFIKEMDTEVTTLPVVKAMIALAHTLKLEVVAEGVERQLQSRMLAGLGCDYAQGFLFSKPLSAQDACAAVSLFAQQPERSVA